MDKYNQTWETLHKNDYFKNHRLYNKFEILKPHNVSIEDIKDKCVLDIGAGYGRTMGWFCKFTEFVYGIEVTPKIINEANDFLTKKNFKNFNIYLTKNYHKFIYNVDYVFCRYVFQHISKEQCKEYIENIHQLLNKNGKINLQFRLGNILDFIENKEPRTEYTIEEINELLKDFTILNIEYANNNKHAYIIGIKK